VGLDRQLFLKEEVRFVLVLEKEEVGFLRGLIGFDYALDVRHVGDRSDLCNLTGATGLGDARGLVDAMDMFTVVSRNDVDTTSDLVVLRAVTRAGNHGTPIEVGSCSET
jgi:hypothetical protein